MSYLYIKPCNGLWGQLAVPAAKNAVTPQMALSLLGGGVCLTDCPNLVDVQRMQSLLVRLGCAVRRTDGGVAIEADKIEGVPLDGDCQTGMRSGLFLLGPLLARTGRATMRLPGGCVIGRRPIDIHLDGLAAMGVRIETTAETLHCRVSHAQPVEYTLRYPSVGATLNLVSFATSIKGKTVLHNVAIEPEVVDCMYLLQRMGAAIDLTGNTVAIEGGRPLHPVEYTPVGDRIVAATILVAVAVVGGDVTIHGVDTASVEALTDKIGHFSCIYRYGCDTIRIRGNGEHGAACFRTGPYPEFATDMQAPALVYNATAWGCGSVCETVYEDRFRVVRELVRMGADIRVVGRCAFTHGRPLCGGRVQACDLRAGAALVIAGLASKLPTCLGNVDLIDRGYWHIEDMLASLGADIQRIDER